MGLVWDILGWSGCALSKVPVVCTVALYERELPRVRRNPDVAFLRMSYADVRYMVGWRAPCERSGGWHGEVG